MRFKILPQNYELSLFITNFLSTLSTHFFYFTDNQSVICKYEDQLQVLNVGIKIARTFFVKQFLICKSSDISNALLA